MAKDTIGDLEERKKGIAASQAYLQKAGSFEHSNYQVIQLENDLGNSQ